MFDPSKLNLNLEENWDDTWKKDSSQKWGSWKKSQTTQQKTENSSKEGLSSIIDPLNDNTEEDLINQKFISNDEKRDQQKQVKKEESIEEQKQEESAIIWDISDVINNNSKLSKLQEKSDSHIMSWGKMININIDSLEYVLHFLLSKQLNVFTLEPWENDVKVTMKSGKLEKEVHYIKYPIYSKILLKAKSLTKLVLDDSQNSQNWEGETQIKEKKYKLVSKTVPSDLWEKIFFKITEINSSESLKVKSKTSWATLLSFFWIITIIALIIGWSFISFIVLNANTLADVKFFQSLWVNLNDINTLIGTIITYIFSALIFVETIFLAVFLFKTLLTKKTYRKKRIWLWIISFFILLTTFATWTAWMVIDRKISSLPNWQEMAFWEVQVFDNGKLVSDQFDKEWALLNSTSDLIWPITLKYDLSFWAKQEERKWFSIKRYVWNIWDSKKEELSPVLIHSFDWVWTSNINLKVIWSDRRGNQIEKVIDISPVNIESIVKIVETPVKSWGKTIRFDATDLKAFGKIDWFFIEKWNKWELESVYNWYDFQPSKIIIDDTLIWMRINKPWRKSNRLDKIFVVQKESWDTIRWEIVFDRDPVDDLQYTFSVENANTTFWNGFIETFTWKIEDSIKSIDAEIDQVTESSKYIHQFNAHWEHKVVVELTDSRWKIKALETTINIPRRLKLKEWLSIYNKDELIKNIWYDAKNNEYYLDELPVPTELKLDARRVKASNILYEFKWATWDINDDGTSDKEWNILNFPVDIEWNYSIVAKYRFQHRRIKDEVVTLEERILIEWIKKDAIVDLQIQPDSTYVPTMVKFDASKSQVKWKNIEKFIYDYWDKVIEERDAVNPWHKYSYPWEYIIKLTVVTTDWEKYTTEKKLILKPKPQAAKIITSMKNAPTNQGIDFSSDQSEGQITWYYWEFGDWEVSIDANPTHSYSKAWEYTVVLKVNFQNNNTLTDEMNIVIRDE